MKRVLLLLSMAFFLSAGLSSCHDEAAEINPEYKAPVKKVAETDKTKDDQRPVRD